MKRYLKGKFLWEFIPLVPLQLLDLNGQEHHFFLIKCLRIIVGFETINVTSIMDVIKRIQAKRLDIMIEDDPIFYGER